MRWPKIGLLVLAGALSSPAQSLSVQWEELTASDFVKAIDQAHGVCVLPFGILEKHGPQLPIGTDLIDVRHVTLQGVRQEFAVVFPQYYFGQIFEARHEPGTIAYSARMQLDLLQETTDEMARNGCRKILIVNGHGGNEHLLPFFAQAQLASPHDYVVYVLWPPERKAGGPQVADKIDAHAGESETSLMMVSRPDLVHMDRAKSESGRDLNREDLPSNVYTGIWWYAKFPDHYAGDAAPSSRELGEFEMNAWASQIANAIRAIKADDVSPRLQREFFEKAAHPVDTKQ